MIDLTQQFKSAIKLKESSSFSSKKWIDALSKITDQLDIEFLWDEQEDNWLKLGNNEKLVIMAARKFPLLILTDDNLMSEFSKIYGNEFINISVDDFDNKRYSINDSEIKSFSSWNTNVIQTNCFSINDLFYATH